MHSAGAAFLDVLTTFKQECVYNAVRPHILSISSVSAQDFKDVADKSEQAEKAGTVTSNSSPAASVAQPGSSSITPQAFAETEHVTSASQTNEQSSNQGPPSSETPASRNGSTTAESNNGGSAQSANGSRTPITDDPRSDGSSGVSHSNDLAKV